MQIRPGFDTYRQGAFTVGGLLRLFCVNFHDQIKHRVYFYKATPLVRLDNELGRREGGRERGRER